MRAFGWTRRCAAAASVIVSLGLLLAAVDSGSAKSKSKRLEPASAAIGVELDSSAPPHSQSAPPPVQFFTINQVLARQEGRSGSTEPTQLAALELRGSILDLPPRALRTPDEPFGLMTFRAPEGVLWTKWRGVEADIEAERKVLQQCRAEPEQCPSPAARKFLAIVAEARGHDGRARIDVVNRAINSAVRYMSDLAQHGVPDLWSAPLATLSSGYGDCEDYVIAKYVALHEAGVSLDDLRLLLVRDRAVRQDHAVLAVRDDDRWLMLDNRHSRLLGAAEVPQLQPLFVIDQRGVNLLAVKYISEPPSISAGTSTEYLFPAPDTSVLGLLPTAN